MPEDATSKLRRIARGRQLAKSGEGLAARLTWGIPQTVFAEAIGTTQQNLSNWERGQNVPGPVNAERYAELIDSLGPEAHASPTI